jgi:hypothetical protein
LTIKGDDKDTHYTLLQGVDIAPTESLNAHCTVLNTTKTAVTLTPSFVTHYRNEYGNVVSALGGDTAVVSLVVNEHKDVTFALPKAEAPQAYDVMLSLSAAGKTITNTIKFHYILHGASATIQNVVWDKESYQKGDTAAVSFSWTPSADTFPGARAVGTPLVSPTVEIMMTDESGVPCGAPATADLVPGTALVSFNIVTTAACVNPALITTIKDATHGVLATGNFRTIAPAPTASAIPAAAPAGSSENTGFLIVLVIAIIGIIIFFVLKQKGKGSATPPLGMMLLAFLLTGGIFYGAPEAYADTWSDAFSSSVYTGVLDKASYVAGETVVVTGTVRRWSCNNAVTVESRVNVDGVTIRARTSPTYGTGIGPDVLLFNGSVPSGGAPANGTLTAPGTAGPNRASFGGWANDGFGAEYAFHNIPFTVTASAPLPPPAPFVTLTQSPSATVVSGTNGFISWNASNGPTCSVVRDGVTIATGQPALVNNYPLGALTANTTLDVTCTNAGGTYTASATFTVTPVPSATISATNCTIGSGASTCNSSVTWSFSNTASPNVKQAGTQFSPPLSSPQVRPVSVVATTFTANDGVTQLNSAAASGLCIGGTSWNGTSCVPPAPTGTLTPSSLSCIIPIGASTCTITMTWVSANTLGTVSLWETNTPSNLTTALGSVPNRALPFTVWVSPSTRYELRDGALVLDFKIITGNCIAGSTLIGGVCTAPKLDVTPTNVDFGTVSVNEVKDGTTMNATWITITNTGGGTLIGDLDFATAPDFACAPLGNCSFNLPPGPGQVAKIRLTAPAAPGPLGAEIVMVNSNGGNIPVTVSGMVIPVIAINPGPLDFGDVILTKFKDLPLTINNQSDTIFVPAGSLIVAAPFSCVTSCDYGIIPPGGQAVIMMRFTPTVEGVISKDGTLNNFPVIQNNTGTLVGNGVPPSFKMIAR